MATDEAFNGLPVLLVDDDTALLAGASRELSRAGIARTLTCDDARRVLELLESPVGVVVLDLSMPHVGGQVLLAEIRSRHPDTPVIVMTGSNDLGIAVNCMREGARDYLVKPVESDRLVSAVRGALEWRVQQAEIDSLRHTLLAPAPGRPAAFARVLTQNGTMLKLFRYLETMARTTHPVLIGGETGTGKELIAEAMHHASGRQGPFVPVSVAGMDDATFADTVFGHVRAAGVAGDRGRAGLIGAAANGTLFLDEVTALPEASQARLSRLLRDGTYFPTGSDDAKKCRARILAATNADVDQALATRAFSRELEFRFGRPRVEGPPLRRRLDDLPLLVTHFVAREAKLFGKPAPHVPHALYQLLRTCDFPGNVLELESMCQHAMARHDGGTLPLAHFRELIVRDDRARAPSATSGEPDRPSWLPERLPTLREAEMALVEEAMRRADGNQGVAAELLGITRDALIRRLAKGRARRAAQTAD